jgi:hypothetical protein
VSHLSWVEHCWFEVLLDRPVDGNPMSGDVPDAVLREQLDGVIALEQAGHLG